MPTHQPSRRAPGAPVRRIGMLSTYPPKLCGLATFAAALTHALRDAGHRVDVVRVNDGSDPTPIGQQVAGELVNGSAASLRLAALVLSRCDTVIVQHEYGIFGGPDGDEVLALLDALSVPAIVVLHTVPLLPSDHQREVLEAVCERAARVIVMTASASTRLNELYTVDASRIDIISHGAALPADHLVTGNGLPFGSQPQLLTWGLLGPGKGIEHVIDAIGLLDDLHPRLRYTVAGVTHPKVFAREGDTYRHELIRRTWSNGVAGTVTFDDAYRNVAQLTRFVASSSLVVLPYDSRDQVTSGVLVDALAAGRPVIATAFPHALELAATSAVRVVPHGDPPALAAAIRHVMGDPVELATMTAAAVSLAPSMSWASVADRYLAVCAELDDLTAPVAM
ncbi:MAG: glycosyltransferase [Ilumatobacteraceae bacterium]